MRTREEHIKWCKERAISEMNYSGKPSSALVSMASDLRKHPETNKEALINLCMSMLIAKPNMERQEAINFIQGFN